MFVLDEDAQEASPKYSYFRGEELKLKSRSLTRILEHAIWDIHASVPEKTRDHLLLHAGAVSREGRSMLLPGPPGVGKSSLVAGLLRSGFRYLSDEVGVIDPVTEQAYPFPKRLSLDPSSIGLFPRLEDRLQDREGLSGGLEGRFVRPEDLDADVGDPAPVRWLVFPTPERDGPPRLSPIPRAEAIRRMAEYAFNLYRYDERGVVLLSRIARSAEAFELNGGSVMERAELVAARLS